MMGEKRRSLEEVINMSEEKVRSPYDMKAPLPYSLRVSFERNGEKVTGHIVGASLVDGTYRYDVLDSEDTLAHGTLYEKVLESEVKEAEPWSRQEMPYAMEERWNPEMPWWQPDVRCCDCSGWSNARLTMKMGDGRQMCPACAKRYLRERFWKHEAGEGKRS